MTLILDETFGGVYLKTPRDDDGNSDTHHVGEIETLSYCRLAKRLKNLGLSDQLDGLSEQLDRLQEVWAEGVTA